MVDEDLGWLDDVPEGASLGDSEPLGVVVGGSLGRGLDVRLSSTVSVEQAKVGTFVTIQGQVHRFFGILTDLSLDSADPRFAASVTDDLPAMASVLSGTAAYATARVTPMLTTSIADPAPQPALVSAFGEKRRRGDPAGAGRSVAKGS